MMKAKDNYVKPVTTIEVLEPCDMLAASSSLDVKDEQGDEDVDFLPGYRGEWGNLWSDTQVRSCSYNC